MHCKCGYHFSAEAAKGGRPFESFLVVRDRDYPAFLKSEMRVLKAAGQDAKLRALATSSELAGCLLECPQCARMLLLTPRSGELVILQRD